MMPIECSIERLQQRFSRPPGCRSYGPEGQDAPELNPKSESRNTKQYQNFKLIMFKTFDKRSGISCKNEKPRPGDKPVDAFVLDFGNSKLFRISDFEFRICNFTYTWCSLHLFLRVFRVLRGQSFCHHEEHEGHEVWITPRAKNAFPLSPLASLRLAPWNIRSTEALSYHSRQYFTGRAPWNTNSTVAELLARSTIPQGSPCGIVISTQAEYAPQGVIPQGESQERILVEV